MKRRIALLPVAAALSLIFSVTAYADVIDEPTIPEIETTGALPIVIIALVLVLAVATVLIIRKLKK